MNDISKTHASAAHPPAPASGIFGFRAADIRPARERTMSIEMFERYLIDAPRPPHCALIGSTPR
jgi:hypothetical protein